ncbi:hypothetical protein GHK68_24345 [Sinorhizobium meliloti]|uniref:hypothetical protein n=1 Tax=Rhizobium meliloti TaxID=382 RepID=UPI00129815A9|nr:hypothetical protein [Sinorhizobium meliloti]MQW45304.1 hypothetical protein [Sinorhizobium meliloti]
MEFIRGPAPGVLIVFVLLGMMAECNGPKPVGPGREAADAAYYARLDAERQAFENSPGAVALRKYQAEMAEAERARRWQAIRDGEKVLRIDPYKQLDCNFYPELKDGSYSPAFEQAMKERFFPALTNGERASWLWDQFKRWAGGLAGLRGYICDPPPMGGGSKDDDQRAAMASLRGQWEHRVRNNIRPKYGDKLYEEPPNAPPLDRAAAGREWERRRGDGTR